MKFAAIFAIALLCGVSAYPRKDGPQCEAPNGGGLMPVLREFVELLPVDKIVNIYLTAVTNDPEVQEVLEYMESKEFLQVVGAVHKSPEFSKLLKLACEKLYLDATYYLNLFNEYLGLPLIPRPVGATTLARPGFHGMVLDIIDVMDVNKLKELFKEKAKTDKYVKEAIEVVKSQDFHKIVEALHATPAYNQMLNDLRSMGIKVDEVIAYVKKYLGM